jgi:hypothetical protein
MQQVTRPAREEYGGTIVGRQGTEPIMTQIEPGNAEFYQFVSNLRKAAGDAD